MYTLDTTAAKKADSIGAYINETGKYVGTFLRAEKLVSQRGTDGIGFSFKDDAGKECRFDVWTKNADGPLSGMNQVNAMMVCLSVRKMETTVKRVKKWDAAQNKEDLMDAECFADLMGKRIGLLLRSEEYEKMKDGHKTGETGWRMNLFACFQADTELMASEILDRKTKPEQLGKITAMLADKPLKKSAPPMPTRAPSGGNDFDDDIPFAPIQRSALYSV